jgi:hypothetical protein
MFCEGFMVLSYYPKKYEIGRSKKKYSFFRRRRLGILRFFRKQRIKINLYPVKFFEKDSGTYLTWAVNLACPVKFQGTIYLG